MNQQIRSFFGTDYANIIGQKSAFNRGSDEKDAGIVHPVPFFNHYTAKTKERPDSDYQEGILVSFRTVANGSSCSSSGTVNGSVNDGGTVEGTTKGSSSCSDNTVRHYTEKVGDNMFVIKPSTTGKENATGMATMGFGFLFMKSSVLADELPGTKFKVRSEKGKLFIKIGKRESPFSVIEAQ